MHGAIIYTREGVIGQVQGIPSPPGMLVFLPKYRLCSGESPWKGRGYRLCREIPHYGPKGLSSAMRRLPGRWRWDPQYGVIMPYASIDEILMLIDPRRALSRLVKGFVRDPRPIEALHALVKGSLVSVLDLGLTGSYALGIIHSASDLDLIAYGEEASLKLYSFFSEIREGPSREYLGGVILEPFVDLSWRRAVIEGISITWTGVPRIWHCPPLRDYYALTPPVKRRRLVVKVERGQYGALLYPPCVRTVEGLWLVSYEYNLGQVFYNGGRMFIDALESRGVLYIGLREHPGRVRILS